MPRPDSATFLPIGFRDDSGFSISSGNHVRLGGQLERRHRTLPKVGPPYYTEIASERRAGCKDFHSPSGSILGPIQRENEARCLVHMDLETCATFTFTN